MQTSKRFSKARHILRDWDSIQHNRNVRAVFTAISFPPFLCQLCLVTYSKIQKRILHISGNHWSVESSLFGTLALRRKAHRGNALNCWHINFLTCTRFCCSLRQTAVERALNKTRKLKAKRSAWVSGNSEIKTPAEIAFLTHKGIQLPGEIMRQLVRSIWSDFLCQCVRKTAFSR